MKQATITLSNELEEAVNAYWRDREQDRELPPDLTMVTQAALQEYLTGQGYLPRHRVLRITPATQGWGCGRSRGV